MLLSIIIVNYNVKHFLEQCLCSVKVAMQGISAEVIVVDNNSSDSSVAYLQPAFPWAKFICNQANAGFAKANNQAFAIASGANVLFLNPDTLLPEDCLHECLRFLETNPEAGAIGVRMIDGRGHFLRESKRAFPAPFTSLFKLAGLSALFPKSRIFSRYHLGHLSENGNHVVDVLAGAFMLVRKKVLDQVGCFDEMFFMYGEDVDLSYRIQKAGWKNYYFSGTSIIHFKGESTKKGSLNYVRMFYQAMRLFVQKHYSSGRSRFFKIFINLAIGLRAGFSTFTRFLKWLGLPLADILITLASIGFVAWLWQYAIKPDIIYRTEILLGFLPLFTLTFILAGWLSGLYDKWYRPGRAWIAMIIAIMCNLAIYSLLDLDYRFSRGVILFGGILASIGILLFRRVLVQINLLVTQDEALEIRQTLITGSEAAYGKVMDLMKVAGRNERVLGRIGMTENEPHTVGSFQQLSTLLHAVPARELIFCIDAGFTMALAMQFIQVEKRNLRYKFYYCNSHSLVGSDSRETSGEALSAREKFAIDTPENRRMKRINDLLWCAFLLLLFPIHLFLVKKPFGLLQNIARVLFNQKTWVGYCSNPEQLPVILPGILGSNGTPLCFPSTLKKESLAIIDYWYAKDYDWQTDMRLLFGAYRQLGFN